MQRRVYTGTSTTLLKSGEVYFVDDRCVAGGLYRLHLTNVVASLGAWAYEYETRDLTRQELLQAVFKTIRWRYANDWEPENRKEYGAVSVEDGAVIVMKQPWVRQFGYMEDGIPVRFRDIQPEVAPV